MLSRETREKVSFDSMVSSCIFVSIKLRNTKTKEKEMFKVKLIIPIAIVIFLMTSGYSFSQETASVNQSGQKILHKAKDLNPKSKLFKLYESQQTKFENTTLVKFELGEDANVILTVYDLEGKVIETLIDDLMDAGVYNVNYKSACKITAGELTYKLEVKTASGIKNVLAVK